MQPWVHPLYKFIPFFADKMPFASTKCIEKTPPCYFFRKVIVYFYIIFRIEDTLLKTKDYQVILKELLKDEKAVFIFTSGNDKNLYVAKEELLEIAKRYTKNSQIYAQELEDAMDCVKEKYEERVMFVVGSFYIYGTVIEKLKGSDKND